MTHEGRMLRGEANYKLGLLNNADTKYYLENKPVAAKPKAKPKPKKEEVED